jgi:hypothetical protein
VKIEASYKAKEGLIEAEEREQHSPLVTNFILYIGASPVVHI